MARKNGTAGKNPDIIRFDLASRQNRTHSTREIFVWSLRKKFGHLSDRAKKIVIDRALTLGHYIYNKVFPASISSRIICSTVVRAAGFCL